MGHRDRWFAEIIQNSANIGMILSKSSLKSQLYWMDAVADTSLE